MNPQHPSEGGERVVLKSVRFRRRARHSRGSREKNVGAFFDSRRYRWCVLLVTTIAGVRGVYRKDIVAAAAVC